MSTDSKAPPSGPSTPELRARVGHVSHLLVGAAMSAIETIGGEPVESALALQAAAECARIALESALEVDGRLEDLARYKALRDELAQAVTETGDVVRATQGAAMQRGGVS